MDPNRTELDPWRYAARRPPQLSPVASLLLRVFLPLALLGLVLSAGTVWLTWPREVRPAAREPTPLMTAPGINAPQDPANDPLMPLGDGPKTLPCGHQTHYITQIGRDQMYAECVERHYWRKFSPGPWVQYTPKPGEPGFSIY